MIGQVATLRRDIETVADLHRSVSVGAHELLSARLADASPRVEIQARGARPADVAIIGVAGIFPKANRRRRTAGTTSSTRSTRSSRSRAALGLAALLRRGPHSPDKSTRSGAASSNDLLFDPMRYGIPPRAIKAVDPLQLMTLEVVRRCLADAGTGERFDHERTSVILGASGGTGDVGSQYAVRSEMPRFLGALAPQAAERLPEWTEDSFAGILLNVVAGRAREPLQFRRRELTRSTRRAPRRWPRSIKASLELDGRPQRRRRHRRRRHGAGAVRLPLLQQDAGAVAARPLPPFDATADGIVISEGIAMVALKRLADAERDGDRIYAVIKGVGGSSDGRAKSLTAPHPDGPDPRAARAPTRWPAIRRPRSGCSRRTAPARWRAIRPSWRQ